MGVPTVRAERIQKDGNNTNFEWLIGLVGGKKLEVGFAVIEDITHSDAETVSPIGRGIPVGYSADAK